MKAKNFNIRPAISSDKKAILDFCVNTFGWGDYIDQVWDYWFFDKRGLLLVAESIGDYDSNNNNNYDDDKNSYNENNYVKRNDPPNNAPRKIGMSHVAICPVGNLAWLEGVRVHPDFRRSHVATELLDEMLAYAGRQGARQASAIVSSENVPSQRMMEKNGFEVASKWVYCNTSLESIRRGEETSARLATLDDFDNVWTYLQNSETYRLSAGRYVMAWHWYLLDQNALRQLIGKRNVVLTEQQYHHSDHHNDDQARSIGVACNETNDATSTTIDGVAILNADGYWSRDDVLQIVYLDSASPKQLHDLFAFAANIYANGKKYKQMHLICHYDKTMISIYKEFFGQNEIESGKGQSRDEEVEAIAKEDDLEIFLLYNKMI